MVGLDPVRRRVLQNMAFNLGVSGLLDFGNTLAKVRVGHYAEVAGNMLRSKWAGQVGKRAQRLASVMASGQVARMSAAVRLTGPSPAISKPRANREYPRKYPVSACQFQRHRAACAQVGRGCRVAGRDPFKVIFPERRIVSFDRRMGRFLFFSMVSDLVKPTDTVLDLGAGRGLQPRIGGPHSRAIAQFKGRCARYIGADVDSVVKENPFIEEAIVIDEKGHIDLPDASVDLVYSFAVMEHVADPARFVAEVERVLKPGGWFCGWTPNKWGYVGLGARIIPNAYHARLLRKIGFREEKDVFPTVYRMNTIGDLRSVFSSDRFESFSFTYNGHPSYNMGSVLLARFWLLVMFFSPPFFRQSVFAFERKRA
jgi:SAM-dependent methyltransferase